MEDKGFLAHWFAGWVKGLENAGPDAQAVILRECGRGCALSYTARVFREVKEQSADLDSFLAALAQRFPESVYTRTGPREISAIYSRCACDLVTAGFVRSPVLCQCSAYNLQANFEQVFPAPVDVSIRASILGGAAQCVLIVSTASSPEW